MSDGQHHVECPANTPGEFCSCHLLAQIELLRVALAKITRTRGSNYRGYRGAWLRCKRIAATALGGDDE